MSARRSRFRSSTHFLAAVVCLVAGRPSAARAQACCAGTGAVTPGRLALHEDALVGVQVKAGLVPGSFDPAGNYVASPPGANELDLEQDVFGAVRVLERGQIAVLVPLIETWRTSLGQSEAGGGLGDVNANVRYDFLYAGASSVVPGIAALAGVTFPTGTPPDAPGLGPLATGATGIGAYQINLGLAAEQTFGPWLFNATGLFAQRTARTVGSGPNAVSEALAVQWTALFAAAYTFENDAALALSVSEVFEGDATINGADSPGTARRLPTVTFFGLLPLSDAFRLQASIYDNPPIPTLGANQTADIGLSITAVRAWR